MRVNESRDLGLASKPFTFFRFNRNYGFTPSALAHSCFKPKTALLLSQLPATLTLSQHSSHALFLTTHVSQKRGYTRWRCLRNVSWGPLLLTEGPRHSLMPTYKFNPRHLNLNSLVQVRCILSYHTCYQQGAHTQCFFLFI